MNGYSIPKATLGRLPQYLQYLKGISEHEGSTISATAIAKALSLGEVQVRKDLSAVSGKGRPKVGYDKNKLTSDIEDRLGYGGVTRAVLVGAGKLGRALLDYDGFEEFGIKIVAAFDCNERVIRVSNNNIDILPIKDLDSYCAKNEIKLGIITVGQGSAQDVCDLMTDCGITAIWNFAPCTLKVSDKILLKQENLALSLAHLKSQMSK